MSDVQQLIMKYITTSSKPKKKKNKTTLSCSYRDKNGCPLNGTCRMENVIYKCTSLTKNNVKKVYLGSSEGEFKKNRYYTTTINNLSKTKIMKIVLLYQHTCGASNQHLGNNVGNLSWEIMSQADHYSNISKRCLLCLHKKLAIALCPNPEELLNKRSEMISKCHHLNKFILMNFNLDD